MSSSYLAFCSYLDLYISQNEVWLIANLSSIYLCFPKIKAIINTKSLCKPQKKPRKSKSVSWIWYPTWAPIGRQWIQHYYMLTKHIIFFPMASQYLPNSHSSTVNHFHLFWIWIQWLLKPSNKIAYDFLHFLFWKPLF